MSKSRGRTSTSSFGSTGRRSHDASRFYGSRLYNSVEQSSTLAQETRQLPESAINSVFPKSSETMQELPDACVHLMITSPPYNVTKDYDDNLTLDEYRGLITRVLKETFRVLTNGGRACVNVANVGRKPYIPLHTYIIHDMLDIGYSMRGEIIWNKGSSAGASTAWGSWQSATNPTLRDVHEYILVFSKGDFARIGHRRNSSITRGEFLDFTKSIWTFPTESAKRVGHPAPFPLELPRRLIQLYSFKGDVILDPFAGSGTTGVAALQCGRRFVGYEKNESYVQIARNRLNEALKGVK